MRVLKPLPGRRASGRMPMVAIPENGTPVSSPTPSMSRIPFCKSASKKFMDGDPMKDATNRLSGLEYSSSGAPTC